MSERRVSLIPSTAINKLFVIASVYLCNVIFKVLLHKYVEMVVKRFIAENLNKTWRSFSISYQHLVRKAPN